MSRKKRAKKPAKKRKPVAKKRKRKPAASKKRKPKKPTKKKATKKKPAKRSRPKTTRTTKTVKTVTTTKTNPKGVKLPRYVEGKGWRGGDSRTLYAYTDHRTGQVFVRPGGSGRGSSSFGGTGPPEVTVRVATRAEALAKWQDPLHSGWKTNPKKRGKKNPLTEREARDVLRRAIEQVRESKDRHTAITPTSRAFKAGGANARAHEVLNRGPKRMAKRAGKVAKAALKAETFAYDLVHGRERTAYEGGRTKTNPAHMLGVTTLINPRSVSSLGKNPTLAEGAEAWGKARGLKVPSRGTPAHRALFAAWTKAGMPLRNPLSLTDEALILVALKGKAKALEAVRGKIAHAGAHGFKDVSARLQKLERILERVRVPRAKKGERRNPDESLAELKRRAKTGDLEAYRRYVREAVRRGVLPVNLSTRVVSGGRTWTPKSMDPKTWTWLWVEPKTNPLPTRSDVRDATSAGPVRDMLLAQLAILEGTDVRGSAARFNELWGETSARVHDEYFAIARRLGLEKANPKKGKRRPKKNPAPSSAKRVKRYGDLPPALKKKLRRTALLAAKRDRCALEDVPIEWAKSPVRAPAGLLNHGDLVAVEYRFEGGKTKRSPFANATYRHAAGDNGRGKKKTRAQTVAIDPETRQVILVSRRGARPGFSTERGLIG